VRAAVPFWFPSLKTVASPGLLEGPTWLGCTMPTVCVGTGAGVIDGASRGASRVVFPLELLQQPIPNIVVYCFELASSSPRTLPKNGVGRVQGVLTTWSHRVL
jgi:hypothetical protein